MKQYTRCFNEGSVACRYICMHESISVLRNKSNDRKIRNNQLILPTVFNITEINAVKNGSGYGNTTNASEYRADLGINRHLKPRERKFTRGVEVKLRPLNKADKPIEKLAKPQRAGSEVVHIAPSIGIADLMPLRTTSHTMAPAQGLWMLT